MKTFISLIAALMILYVGRDTETHVSIVETPTHLQSPPLSTTTPFEVKYQHVRFVGEEIEVIAHDLWEMQVLYLYLPVHIQAGDRLLLDNHNFRYQKEHNYRLVEGYISIEKNQKQGEINKVEALLQYCVADENETFCVTKMPIRIVY